MGVPIRRVPFSILVVLIPLRTLSSQNFFDVLQRADSTEQHGGHAAAMRLYEQAYDLSGFDPAGLVLAARSAALAGLRDAAFTNLNRAIDQGYIVPKLLADSAFTSLHGDPRWQAIDTKMHAKMAALDESLRGEIIKLAEQDRQNRLAFRTALTTAKPNSPERDAALKTFTSTDSAIESRIRAIIADHGWPTRSRVADDGAHAAWLVVQNMPLEYQALVLPKLQAAVKAGEAQPGDGALLQDRVLARSRKPQIYGSQLSLSPTTGARTVDPIEDEACVDVRRESVGLGPLADYVKQYGVVYRRVGVCTAK